jgi:hypothetical protein
VKLAPHVGRYDVHCSGRSVGGDRRRAVDKGGLSREAGAANAQVSKAENAAALLDRAIAELKAAGFKI